MKPTIASSGARVRAGIVDGLLFLPVFFLDRYVDSLSLPQSLVFAYFLLTWQFGWLYTTALHGWRGQTVGKALVGIRVVRHADRGPLGWWRAVVRDSPYIILVLASSAVWTVWNLAYVAGQMTPGLDAWADTVFEALSYINLGWIMLEFMTMILHPERRSIHDLLAGSVVVEVALAAEPDSYQQAGER
jgi:uncharacterized RDD family membrane protein YckC